MKLDNEYFRKKATEYVSYFADDMSSDQINGLYLLLKEVNRDTRHACASACLSIVNDDIYKDTGTKSPYEAYVIAKNEASVACMNVGG